MEPSQKNPIFADNRKSRNIPDGQAAINAAEGTQVILDRELCRALAEYVKRYSADDSLIEVKGKLIKYIRGI